MPTLYTTTTAKRRRNLMSPLWRLLNQRWNWVSGSRVTKPMGQRFSDLGRVGVWPGFEF